MNTGDVLRVELSEHQGVLAVINQQGDKKTIWDRRNPVEVEAARREFDFFKEKKYLAYKVEGSEGRRGEVITKFNPDAERIIFAPPMVGGAS